MAVRMIKIDGKELVIMSRSDFDSLMEKTGVMPRLPKPAKDGSVPALQFAAADIAREVIRRRIAAGMTQQELAKRVGVRPETISRLESAKHLPRIETIERIDRVLPPLSAAQLGCVERRFPKSCPGRPPKSPLPIVAAKRRSQIQISPSQSCIFVAYSLTQTTHYSHIVAECPVLY